MIQRDDQLNQSEDSRLKLSRIKSKKKSPRKPSPFAINMENYLINHDQSLQRIDPKGLIADSIYASFSGVIEQANIYTAEENLQVSYQIETDKQWHDQTPQVNDKQGTSTFCQVKNNKITFSLSFDILMSCSYITSWPQLIMTFKSFDFFGNVRTVGYAQIYLSSRPGQRIKTAYIYSIVQNSKWYQKWFPFFQPDLSNFDVKDFQSIITKGKGRQLEKIKVIGKIKIRTQVLLRNYKKFGYR